MIYNYPLELPLNIGDDEYLNSYCYRTVLELQPTIIQCKANVIDRQPRVSFSYKIPPLAFRPADVCCASNLQIIDVIRQVLTPKQTQMLENTCFGHFLQIPTNFTFQGNLVHSVLNREVWTENVDQQIWFVVGGRPCRFSTIEFALITGLKMGSHAESADIVNLSLPSTLRWTEFTGHDPVTVGQLQEHFMRKTLGDDDDSIPVRLALLLLLSRTLLGLVDEDIVDILWLRLADNVNVFQSYPWGNLVWQATFSSIVNTIATNAAQLMSNSCIDLQQPQQAYILKGFVYAFQVWIYEAIVRAGELYGIRQKNLFCPRILRWTAVTQPTDSTIKVQLYSKARFSCNEVVSTLQPSQTEKNSTYYKSVTAREGPVRPIQFVDGFKSLQIEDNKVTTSIKLKPHDKSLAGSWGEADIRDVSKTLVLSAISQLRTDILTGLRQIRTELFDEIDCHYRILMEELRQGSHGLIDDEDGATGANYLHQLEMGHQRDNSNGMPPVLPELHEPVRRTRGLRKRRRLTAFAEDSHVNHRSMGNLNLIAPGTAIIPPPTIKLEALAEIDPHKLAHFNQMMDLKFEDITVHNFWEELIPVDYKWFQIVAAGDWLNNDHVSVYLRLIKQTLFNSQFEQHTRCACIDSELWASLSGLWAEMQRDHRKPHNVRFDPYLITRFLKGERHWSAVDQVYLPINFGGAHWAAAEISFIDRRITIYDPLIDAFSSEQVVSWMACMRVLLPRLLIQCSDFHRERCELLVTTAPFEVIRVIGGLPQQQPNSGDCGVFMLKFIEYLTLGVPFNFNAQDAPLLRMKIAASILLGEIV